VQPRRQPARGAAGRLIALVGVAREAAAFDPGVERVVRRACPAAIRDRRHVVIDRQRLERGERRGPAAQDRPGELRARDAARQLGERLRARPLGEPRADDLLPVAAEVHGGVERLRVIAARLRQIPPRLTQRYLTTWPTSAQLHNCSDKNDMLSRGMFDVSFDSAPQIDRFGNLNITAIGDYRRPTRRLIGALAQTDHFAYVSRPLILTDLKKRTFVEKVDFITSVGHLAGGTSRTEAGLRPGGPSRVITDKAIFGFHEETKAMEVLSVHATSTIEDVLAAMSFEPHVPTDVPTTAAPTADEIRLIRELIDPRGILLVS